jgi:flavin reductase (DIM6/NTAB) family NADH-FMN oxidoreductase RutF
VTHFKEVALAARQPPDQPRAHGSGDQRARHGAQRDGRRVVDACGVHPPRIAIVIDKKTYTRELIMASGGFGVCIPGTVLAGLTHAAGSESGRTVDKFAQYGLKARTGPVLGMPLLEDGCAAWLECRLISEPHTEDAYDTCFAEVVAAAADERVFQQGHWRFGDDNRRSADDSSSGRRQLRQAGGMFHAGDAAAKKP